MLGLVIYSLDCMNMISKFLRILFYNQCLTIHQHLFNYIKDKYIDRKHERRTDNLTLSPNNGSSSTVTLTINNIEERDKVFSLMFKHAHPNMFVKELNRFWDNNQ
ncbi:hypothetical protein RF11_07091 [Thelohanellus kitauei]|uniref:Uncharacterized protein n=1 Tax=Thelohanellus kitauei TaxID=669202 RepID=A0A0C2MKR7_THEKT|nr:hypothetical protein RF11_07091 [Thelohanellus kitauei]